jgi:hypothetical protein
VGPGEDGKGCVPVRTKRTDLRARYPMNHKLRPGHRNNHDHACLGDRSHPNPPTAHRQILRAQLGHTKQPEPPTLHSHLQPPGSKNPKSSSERHTTPNIMGSNREPHPSSSRPNCRLPSPRAPPSRSSLALLPAPFASALHPRAPPSRSSLALLPRAHIAPSTRALRAHLP